MAEHANNDGVAPDPSSQSAPTLSRAEHDPLEEPLQVVKYGIPPVVGLRVAGGIDLRSHEAWEQALRQTMRRDAELYLDLANLVFIDVRGVTVLVDAASRLTGGHQVIVQHAPPCLPRIMQVLWPPGVAAIKIEGGSR